MWKMYPVAFRLMTPLHSGQMKLGNVQRTRHYVTGKMLWGALTERMTRDNPESNGNYHIVGDCIKDKLAFSYFYPSISPSPDAVDIWPWGDQVEDFAWRYLNTYASTALNATRSSAEEGSLHETEHIAPVTREGKQVYLVGFIFEKEGSNLNWRKALSDLQMGGERTYGWGRVRLAEKPADAAKSFWSGWGVAFDGDRPWLCAQGDKPTLYAHTEANKIVAKGRIEPLVGRGTTDANAHGQNVQYRGVYFTPGSQIDTKQIDTKEINTEQTDKEIKLKIGDYGEWG